MSLKPRVSHSESCPDSCLLGHKVCLAERVKFPSWMPPRRGWFPPGNAWGCSREVQPPTSVQDKHEGARVARCLCQSSVRNSSTRTRGKKLPRGAYRATDVPWRTRNKEKEQQPSGREAEHSAELETGRPGANVAAPCQGLCLFCPCFICPGAIWGTFFSPVINLQVSWAFSSFNNLVFANVYFELAVSVH